MPKDLMRYDILLQDTLRDVVRRILVETAKNGLPGEHHFYIVFHTDFDGVRISDQLRARYPKEITIVLQYQFWDLTISDSFFEVCLSFGGVSEKLSIPFAAISCFFDPTVRFALEFDQKEGAKFYRSPYDSGDEADMPLTNPDFPDQPYHDGMSVVSANAACFESNVSMDDDQQDAVGGKQRLWGDKGQEHRQINNTDKQRKSNAAGAIADDKGHSDGAADKSSADIVSLDSFRKDS